MPFKPKHKDKIIEQIDFLCDETKEFDRLMMQLSLRKVITEEEINNLKSENGAYVRNFNFYKMIVEKDKSAHGFLLEALRNTGQSEVANAIDDKFAVVEKMKSFFSSKKSTKHEEKPEDPAQNTPDVVNVAKANESPNSEGGIIEESPIENEKKETLTAKTDANDENINIEDKNEKNKEKKPKKGMISGFVPSFLRGKAETKDVLQGKLAEFRTKENLKKLQEAFKAYDTDHSGKISVQEFCELMKELCQMNEEDSKTMLKMSDSDGDGEIDYFEFVALFLPST